MDTRELELQRQYQMLVSLSNKIDLPIARKSYPFSQKDA